MSKLNFRWVALITVNVVGWSVLSFYGTSGAAPQTGQPPFRNAVEQREEIILHLKDIKALLKEQNGLLRADGSKDAAHESRRN